MLRDLIIGYGLYFGLVVSRIGGFVVASPFPGPSVPRSQRVALVLAVAVTAMPSAPSPLGLPTLETAVPGILREIGLGVAVGFLFRMTLAAAEVAGELASQALGLGAPTLFNPNLGAQETVITRLFSIFALLIALGLGAHRTLLTYLLDSFTAVPPGAPTDVRQVTAMLVELTGQSLAVGLRMALPVLAVSLAIQVGLAIVARLAPSLQIFNIGFAILIGAGLLVLVAAAADIMRPLAEHLAGLSGRLERLFTDAATPSAP